MLTAYWLSSLAVDAAADVVDVVRVAIVRGVDRHDRPEVGRPEHRHLDRREAALADPPHPDVAVRPGLGREPLDRVDSRRASPRRCTRRGRSRGCCRCPGCRAGRRHSRGRRATGRGPRRSPSASRPCGRGSSRGSPGRRGSSVAASAGDRQPEVGRQLEPVADRNPDVAPDLDLERRAGEAGSIGHRSGRPSAESRARPATPGRTMRR